MEKIKNIIKKYKKTSAIVLIVLLVVVFKVFGGGGEKLETFVVKKGIVSKKVVVSGKVRAKTDANLSFEKAGRVSSINVKIGDKVFVGQTLISLDSASAYADYVKAKANVSAEIAKLEELKRGSTEEEISLKETEVLNYETALKNALNNLSNKLLDSLTKSDDSIRNYVDQFFSNPKSLDPQISFAVNDNQLKNEINQTRLSIENVLNDWKNLDFKPTSENILKTEQALNEMKVFLDKVSLAVNSLTPNSNISQTTIDTYKASVSTARTNITTAVNNLSTAEEKLNSAKASLSVAVKNLAIIKSGSTKEELQVQEARVLQYEAEVTRTQAELSKLTIKSPISGIVTKQEASLGEIVSSGTIVVSVISDNDYEILANISEVSVGSVSVGSPVFINMDAFPDIKNFLGQVAYIEPGETLIDGVVNFKTTVTFNENYPEIKPGLTANLDIQTYKKENVLVVPEYGIEKVDDKNIVTVMESGRQYEKEISIDESLVGNDGLVEVLSGLNEGDVIVLNKKI